MVYSRSGVACAEWPCDAAYRKRVREGAICEEDAVRRPGGLCRCALRGRDACFARRDAAGGRGDARELTTAECRRALDNGYRPHAIFLDAAFGLSSGTGFGIEGFQIRNVLEVVGILIAVLGVVSAVSVWHS